MIIRFRKHTSETLFLDFAPLVLLFTAILIGVSYFFIDIPLAQYFEHLTPPLRGVFALLSMFIDPKYQYLLWPFLYFLLNFIYKKPLLANRCLFILLSIAFANITTDILKAILGRARPEELFAQGIYGFSFFASTDAFYSFPSGHACTIGAICGSLTCFRPRFWLLFLLIAFFLAFTRVLLTMHFLSDIFAGLTIGLLISQWIYKIMDKQKMKF